MEFVEEERQMQIYASHLALLVNHYCIFSNWRSSTYGVLRFVLKIPNSTSCRAVQRSIDLAAEQSIILTQTGTVRPLCKALPC